MDRREELLNKYDTSRKYIEQTCRPELFAAMDEYMKECCLELLEYMAKNMVICGHYSSPDGLLFKVKGHELLTKEQLFENFL